MYCCCVVFRYRERLGILLEEERSQRKKNGQHGMCALEEQQQQLLEAQQSATQALNETDTCMFIHRWNWQLLQLKWINAQNKPKPLWNKNTKHFWKMQTIFLKFESLHNYILYHSLWNKIKKNSPYISHKNICQVSHCTNWGDMYIWNCR